MTPLVFMQRFAIYFTPAPETPLAQAAAAWLGRDIWGAARLPLPSVPGIDADCGGECACGTCHVILADRWFNIAGNTTVNELQMLDLTPEKTSTSRLACQIQVSDAMNGMQVYLPEFQM